MDHRSDEKIADDDDDERRSSTRKRSRPDEEEEQQQQDDDGDDVERKRAAGGDHGVTTTTTNNDLAEKNGPNSSSSSQLPKELASVDFTKRIAWKKFQPYTDTPLPLVPENIRTAVVFKEDSPALCHHIHAVSNHARACTVHLKCQKGQRKETPIPTPMFMPVGTKGCLKGLSIEELTTDPALACPIILANTYHLALQPGTELIDRMGGLQKFQGLDKTNGEYQYNLLTDSGGFQMVSLVKLSSVSEEGVSFENPFTKEGKVDYNNKNSDCNRQSSSPTDIGGGSSSGKEKDMMLLRPEDSIKHQNNISANIIMALDDVVSSVTDDDERFTTATYRTLRWFDRCYEAHSKKDTQNLFPIVQGGLDTGVGGLRERCLAGFRHRELELGYQIPGYAIGGLAGGESKEKFWRVVHQCCKALPDNKPRYLMGVGYPIDLVVCTALGVDLFDCVFPTRTARFGSCLVPGPAPGTLRLRSHEFASDHKIIQQGCKCQACREGVTRSRLHSLVKTQNPVAVELITQHNIAYVMALVRSMRQSIMEGKFSDFAINFVRDQYRGKASGGEDPPAWVIEALAATGIDYKY